MKRRVVFILATLFVVGVLSPQTSFDFSLTIVGPTSVVQGHDLYLMVRGKVTAGTNDKSPQYMFSGVPPGMTVASLNGEWNCCDGSSSTVYRLNLPVIIHLRTTAAAPLGVQPLTVTYICQGVTKAIDIPINVLPPPQPLLKAAAFPPDTRAPELARYEAQMVQYGRKYCTAPQGAWDTSNLYYDGARVFQNITAYTGKDSWLECADAINTAYANYVIGNSGVPGFRVFPQGLRMTFNRIGDEKSKEAIGVLSERSWGTWQPDYAIGWKRSREVSYALESRMIAISLGFPDRRNTGFLVESLMGMFDEWFVSKTAELPPQIHADPFMVALASEAMIQHYDATQDPRVPWLLTLAADGLWADSWDPATRSFYLYNTDARPVTRNPAPDLNLFIAPLFGWVFQQTGDVRYRDMGDKVFASGVRKACLECNAKHFNQNYRWSMDYLKWRQSPEAGSTSRINRRRGAMLREPGKLGRASP